MRKIALALAVVTTLAFFGCQKASQDVQVAASSVVTTGPPTTVAATTTSTTLAPTTVPVTTTTTTTAVPVVVVDTTVPALLPSEDTYNDYFISWEEALNIAAVFEPENITPLDAQSMQMYVMDLCYSFAAAQSQDEMETTINLMDLPYFGWFDDDGFLSFIYMIGTYTCNDAVNHNVPSIDS